MKSIKPGKKRKGRKMKRHSFTWELLPPGTLNRKDADGQTPKDRWQEIISTCSQVMTESNTKEFD